MVELAVSLAAVLAVILGSLWWVSMDAEEPPFSSMAAPRHARKRQMPRRWRRWLLAALDLAIVVVLVALVALALIGHD